MLVPARLVPLTSLLALLLGMANAGEVRVCLPSQAMVSDCDNVMSSFGRSDVTYKCMAPEDSSSETVAEIKCLEMIQQEQADLTVVGDVELYWANKRHGLVAYVSEDYRDNTGPFSDSEALLDYYSIAVVPKDGEVCKAQVDNQFEALKGRKACHTGYRKNAGWLLPVGYLALQNIMPVVEDPENKVNTDAYSVSQFFSQVCAPRTVPDGPINDGSGSGKKYEGLCGLCDDDCSENDPYAGYAGALQCLKDGEGDVAFVKHTTPEEQSLNGDDYDILCAQGCKPLSFYEEKGCSMGQRPPSALVAREGWGSTTDGQTVIDTFVSDGDILKETKGILWSEDTKTLTAIGNPRDFETFMRSFDNYDQIYQMGDANTNASPSGSPSVDGSSSSSSSSGGKNGVVDGGGAAGIAIGCFFGGVFVLAAIMWVVNRNKKSKWDNINEAQQQQLGAAHGFKETNNPMAAGAPAPPANDAAKGAMRV